MKAKVIIWVLAVVVGLPLWASCSNDSEADLAYLVNKNAKDMERLVNAQGKGTYDMVWIMNNTIVDTATFSSEIDPNYYVITHFPMDDLHLSLWGRVASGSDYFRFTYNYQSFWVLDLAFVGYSSDNAYLSNSSWNPRTFFQFNEGDWMCQMWFSTEQAAGRQTTLMYDTGKDVWSGSVSIDSFTLTRLSDKESGTWRKHPYPLNLSFQTTGRKQK